MVSIIQPLVAVLVLVALEAVFSNYRSLRDLNLLLKPSVMWYAYALSVFRAARSLLLAIGLRRDALAVMSFLMFAISSSGTLLGSEWRTSTKLVPWGTPTGIPVCLAPFRLHA